MKKLAIVATAIVAFSGLTACGGSESDKFCDSFADIGTVDPSNPDAAKDIVKKLKDIEAPGDIKDEFKTYVSSLEKVTEGDTAAVTDFTKANEAVVKYVTDNCK